MKFRILEAPVSSPFGRGAIVSIQECLVLGLDEEKLRTRLKYGALIMLEGYVLRTTESKVDLMQTRDQSED